jgi:hypothetical protein
MDKHKELYTTLTQLAEGDMTTASVISKVPVMMHAIEKVNGVLKMKGSEKKKLADKGVIRLHSKRKRRQ